MKKSLIAATSLLALFTATAASAQFSSDMPSGSNNDGANGNGSSVDSATTQGAFGTGNQ